jgi:hypothetical protein
MKRLSLALLAGCIAITAFGQGLYWQSKTTGTVGEFSSETFVIPKKMKVVNEGDDGSIIIVRLDRELIWTVHPQKKEYSEMTFAQMEEVAKKAGGKMDAAMAKMREEMRNMPEEQRKMMEKMMGDKMPGMLAESDTPVQVDKTAEKKSIAGFSCVKYVVRRGDQVLSTLWVTKDVKGFSEVAEDWKAFSRRMAALAQRFGKELAEATKQIDGFPMQSEVGGVVTTVTKLERRATPAGEFDIPSGYKKVKSDLEDAMQKMDEE